MCAVLPLAVCAAAHAQPGAASWIPTILSGPGETLGNDPALTDSGDVYFVSTDAAGSGMFSTRAGGPLLTIYGKNFGLSSLASPNANSSGDFSFLATDATGPALFTSSSGGPVITVRGSSFGLSSLAGPSMNSSGTTMFTATDLGTGSTGVYSTSPGGGIITIIGQNFGSLALTPGSAKPTASGEAVFAATDLVTGGEGVYSTSGGGVLLTIKGANFGESVKSTSTTTGGTVVTPFTDVTDSQFLASGGGGGMTGTIPWEIAPVSIGSVNDNGFIALGYEQLNGRTAPTLDAIGVTDLTGSFHDIVASVGDVFDGKTVSSLSFADAGLNNNDQLAFHAGFDDGSSGIFLVNIPAPGAGAAIVVASGAVLIRRRR